MKMNSVKILCVVAIASFGLLPMHSSARPKGAVTASANGKYMDLIQELNCYADEAKYGNFKDYGYWQGGRWCGQVGQAGYWVWLKPTWYVWATKKEQRR